MEPAETLKLFGLSKKEQKILLALQAGSDTPVKLSKATDVSRTAIYAILQNLKRRGLAQVRTTNGKKHWSLTPEREIEEVLYEAKRALLKIPEGREEVKGMSDSLVVVHRGVDAVKKVLGNIFINHKNERFYALVGDKAGKYWNGLFTLQETNRFNRSLKQNGLIAENILQEGLLERQTRELGVSWAKDFEGRTARANVLPAEYFDYASQVFVLKESIYLMSLSEELVIEIRHSEIQKMLLTWFRFMQDNSELIDANERLRGIIAEMGGKKETAQ